MIADDDSARVWVALLIIFLVDRSVVGFGALFAARLVAGVATLANTAFIFEGLILLEGAWLTSSTSSLHLFLPLRPLLLNRISTKTTSEGIGVPSLVGSNIKRSTCDVTGVVA